MLATLSWTGDALRLLDQTKLPMRTEFVDITDERQAWDAIKRLVVRGAPAIGVAAAFAAYLGVRNFEGDPRALMLRLSEVCDHLAHESSDRGEFVLGVEADSGGSACATGTRKRIALAVTCKLKLARRPACRLQPACLQVRRRPTSNNASSMSALRCSTKTSQRVAPSASMARSCFVLSRRNLRGISSPTATPAHWLRCRMGRRLAPIYAGIEQGMKFHVFADETRPLLQGSRLTAWELKQNNVPVTVLCDNMAASLMSAGKIDAVLVGADRIAANGDTANKIGTLGVAILARYFRVPFFVVAPTSTVDLSLATGRDIPIEHRDASEVTHPFGTQTAPDGVEVFNPAFDVTPAELVRAIVTEHGVARAPYVESLARVGISPSPSGRGSG